MDEHSIMLWFLALLWVTPCLGHSGIAGTGACTNGIPGGSSQSPRHGSQVVANNPFTLTVSGLTNNNYEAGRTYTITLSGTTSFSGFLIQPLTGGGNIAAGTASQIITCNALRGITHTGSGSKTTATGTWTAPTSDQASIKWTVLTGFGGSYYINTLNLAKAAATTSSSTPTKTGTPTSTITPSQTPSRSRSIGSTLSNTPSASLVQASASNTQTATKSRTFSPTATQTSTKSLGSSNSATITRPPSTSTTPTRTRAPGSTASVTPSNTPTATRSVSRTTSSTRSPSATATPSLQKGYTSPDGVVDVLWTLTNETVTFVISTTKTSGWVGIGISNHHQMLDSDIILAYSVSGGVTIVDAFASAYERPTPDTRNDLTLEAFTIDGSGWTATISRPLDTGDSQDVPIISTSQKGLDILGVLLWAHGDGDQEYGSIQQHTAKGSVDVDYLSGVPTVTPIPTVPPGVQSGDGVLDLQWAVAASTIEFTLKVQKTIGWAAIGINTRHSMVGSDIIVAYFNTAGGITVVDAYATAYERPTLDATNSDLNVESSAVLSNSFSVTISRLLNTRDAQDIAINPAAPGILLWAYGPGDGQFENIEQHTNKGSADVDFLTGRVTSTPTPTPTTGGFTTSDGVITVSWSLDEAAESITFNIQANTNTGWIGLGVSNNNEMVGADVMLIWINSGTGAISVEDTFTSARARPVIDDHQDLTVDSASIVDSVLTVFVTRKWRTFNTGDVEVLVDGTEQYLIWGNSGSRLSTFEDISQHSTTHRGAQKVNFRSGQTTDASTGRPDTWTAHGVCMILAWGFLIPFGIFSAKFGMATPKRLKFFKIHRAVQATACLISLIGMIIGFSMVPSSEHFRNKTHGVIGAIMFVLVFLQPALAFMRPDHGAKFRELWYLSHAANAYILQALALANLFLGFGIYAMSMHFRIFFAFWILLLICVAIYLHVSGRKPLTIINPNKFAGAGHGQG